jgi:hypothetical protein
MNQITETTLRDRAIEACTESAKKSEEERRIWTERELAGKASRLKEKIKKVLGIDVDVTEESVMIENSRFYLSRGDLFAISECGCASPVEAYIPSIEELGSFFLRVKSHTCVKPAEPKPPVVMPENGGSAFPLPADYCDDGISKRDYFAAKAMQGICANPSDEFKQIPPIVTARVAYDIADAMLKVRKEPVNA